MTLGFYFLHLKHVLENHGISETLSCVIVCSKLKEEGSNLSNGSFLISCPKPAGDLIAGCH